MTRCEGTAHLMAEGRVVGALRCELEAGHDDPDLLAFDIYGMGSKSHEATLHWEDGEVIAEDDDEPSVDVPFDEPRRIDFGAPKDDRAPFYGGRDEDGL